jgi:hypothetical protein
MKMKVDLYLSEKYSEESMTYYGYRYRYILDDKYKSSGSFDAKLLPLYEELYNVIKK